MRAHESLKGTRKQRPGDPSKAQETQKGTWRPEKRPGEARRTHESLKSTRKQRPGDPSKAQESL